MYHQSLSLQNLLKDPQFLGFPTSPIYEDDLEKKEDSGPILEKQSMSAYLGPQLWNKTLDYDEFNLEYMDLDEFLAENGFQAESEEFKEANSKKSDGQEENDLDTKIVIDFSISPQDLALASVPGQNIFDPRKRKFSVDELKPQPMMKKSKKSYVPESLKDDNYWTRRNKNNLAAKRSRDARRVKENQIAMRAAYLEKENDILKKNLNEAQMENKELKRRLTLCSS